MSTSGDVESTSSSLPGSAAGSPRSKVKFLCSHGGKILPRPADGHLKYVGGETRVVSVPRTITFTDLMKKLTSLIEGAVTLKYQLITEELDALVSVKSDEDLRHMFEEYDRQDLTGTPRLRTFLFPANPIIIDNPVGPMDRHSLEQRYINSINGIIFNPIPVYNSGFRPPAVNTSQTSFTISSACSSPRTPPEATVGNIVPAVGPNVTNPENTGFHKGGAMSRARSSPNLCNFGSSSQPNYKNQGPISTLNLGLNNQQYPCYQQHRQPPPPPPPNHYHPPVHHPQQYPKPPLDPSPHKNSSPDHFMRMRSSGLADYYRHQTEQAPNLYARSSRSSGHMGYQRGSPYDEYYANNNRYDRESPPGSGSPLARSPLHNNYVSKWDSNGGR
ncbi:putative PB1 domain-containing protein [Helianthus annuus]|uniref:PB1 domain-containing protein n=1 Tax=Helianthus annuus TaxID=4232 RepID=A0A251V5Q6_HELAN|nr:uncharacterized protein LOC110928934 [Helianthus annuus]KAF5813901.1 putative PB1 domain-containing protein [Helianthus annuus]KAJ0592589.1 putative PB1 domain-containing protein [Helianthus annuus]KAJ0600189.1 putative PB1 domain-containing protein [Helianthus annuus]KAJ0607585.1 putative PB1 domain-containing protein [Helianthus annuus]KAJ0767647.1 putative PB1 domain-containing protein [Helianthus annuus]